MRFFHKYKNHTTFENRPIILRKPDVSLCSIEGTKKNGMHYNYLPYDAEIEYLKSTGTQYIDTEYIPNANTELYIQFSISKFNTTMSHATAPFGLRVNWQQNQYVLFCPVNRTTSEYFCYGNTQVNFAEEIKLNQRYICNVNKNVWTLTSNGTTVGTNTSDSLETNNLPNLNLWLFNFNNNNSVPEVDDNINIYSFIIKENGNIIMDLIPVRVGTTGYMYDKVSKQLFGNSGTGNFTLGQDIVPIEYIRSTGTQYINTGVKPNTNTKVRLKFKNLVITGNVIIGYMGSGDSNDWRFFNATSKAYFDVINSRINTSGAAINANVNYEIELGNYYIKNLITGTNIISGSSKTYTGDRAITLNGDKSFSQNIFYYVKIFDGNTLIRDFVPVRVGTVGYLFDKVNRQLYGNAGSGAFTLGPDIT